MTKPVRSRASSSAVRPAFGAPGWSRRCIRGLPRVIRPPACISLSLLAATQGGRGGGEGEGERGAKQLITLGYCTPATGPARARRSAAQCTQRAGQSGTWAHSRFPSRPGRLSP
eukprot:scaffold13210_cov109-Isochrysis_galbana.AAC.8